MAVALCLSSAASVAAHPHSAPLVSGLDHANAYPRGVEGDVSVIENLLVDNRVAVPVITGQENHELRARNPKPQASSSSSSGSSSTSAASPLPNLLEDNLSGNFTTSGSKSSDSPCGNYLASLVADPTFQQCYPFSVLLLGSKSFFQAQKSLVSITNVLDKSCRADVKSCSSYLSGVAGKLTAQGNCGVDYDLANSLVSQLRYALLSYQTLYSATCLRDPTTQAYCFASAVTNSSNSQNTYFYYLPMNATLPSETSPNCNWCVRETMAIFQANAANRKLPIATTYSGAAAEVNSYCGESFVNATMPAEIQSSSASAGLRITLAGSPFWSVLSTAGVALAAQWML